MKRKKVIRNIPEQLDSNEDVKKCLSCPEETCTNCLGKKGDGHDKRGCDTRYRVRIDGKIEMLTEKKVAQLLGIGYSTLSERRRRGGKEFAVSGVKKYEDFLKIKEEMRT